jgi:glycosyltransferase involved in cell wall biosynthesis
VGALWPFKGHDAVIRAISLLPESKRAPLRIVADRELPGYSRTLERLADQLGVQLSISTRVERPELRSLYLGATVVACAQRREPYGLVPLEAMSCGRAVAAFSEGGFVENMRHGDTGLLVDPTPESLSRGLDLLLEDEDLRRRLGQRGRQFVLEERTREKGAEDLASLMDSFLSGRSE